MGECDPTNNMPGRCVEAFTDISSALGRIDGKLNGIHEQTKRTNGHVEALYGRTDKNKEHLLGALASVQALESHMKATQATRSKWGRRVWQAFVGLSLLVIGYLLKS